MRGIVVYYSGTGCTAKIAKAIYRGMKEKMECDIASIRKIDPATLGQYDVVAIGGPIWYFRETANLRLFIYKMPDMAEKLCIPFCTHGTSPTGFFWSMVPMLTRKGMTVIGWNDWYGSVYQVLHAPKPYFTDGHPDEIDLKEAEDFGQEMADRALKIEGGDKSLIPELPKGKNSDTLWQPVGVFMNFPTEDEVKGKGKNNDPGMRATPISRTVNKEKCTYPDCTLCIDNCPVHAIDFKSDPPKFRGNCVNCSLCDKMCPQGAIDVDEETMKNRTRRIINMDKCKYPECSLCADYCTMGSIDFSANPPVIKKSCEGDDLCWVICPTGAIEITNLDTTHARMVPKKEYAKNHPFTLELDEAEAKGRFRRLVSIDDIGWDTPVMKNPNTPRFVIEED